MIYDAGGDEPHCSGVKFGCRGPQASPGSEARFSGFGVMTGDPTESPQSHERSAARLADVSGASRSAWEWQDDLSGVGAAAWVGQAHAQTDAANSDNAANSITNPRIFRTQLIPAINDKAEFRTAATL